MRVRHTRAAVTTQRATRTRAPLVLRSLASRRSRLRSVTCRTEIVAVCNDLLSTFGRVDGDVAYDRQSSSTDGAGGVRSGRCDLTQ